MYEGDCFVMKTINYPHSRGLNDLVCNKLHHRRHKAANSKILPWHFLLNGSIHCYKSFLYLFVNMFCICMCINICTCIYSYKTMLFYVILTCTLSHLWQNQRSKSDNKWKAMHTLRLLSCPLEFPSDVVLMTVFLATTPGENKKTSFPTVVSSAAVNAAKKSGNITFLALWGFFLASLT